MRPGPGPGPWAAAVVLRVAALTLAWWAMTEGYAGSWRYALVVVPLATACSVALAPPRRAPRPSLARGVALVRLAGWFLGQSVLGGVDVARRCLRRPVDVDPAVVTYTTALPEGAPRVWLIGLSSLMPGSLMVDLDGDVLHVHVLDRAMPAVEQLRGLERRITATLPRG